MRTVLYIALLLGVILAILAVPLAAWIAYGTIVPAHSASTLIADLRTTVTLHFYYTWDGDNDDRGRYLHVNGPTGQLRIAMRAFDWAHWARTSVYLTPRREIVVLGPTGDDYLISVNPLRSSTWVRGPSDDWTYLGAFDYRSPKPNEYQLRFNSAADQAECIPMRGVPALDFMVRNAARQDRCN